MIKDNLNEMIAETLKAKDSGKLKVLRLIKSEYQKFMTAENAKQLDDAAELKILKKLQKQWKEELEAAVQNNRDTFDLTYELKYLETFIPQELTEEEQQRIATEVIEGYLLSLPVEDRKNMKHLGAIIKVINAEHPMVSGKIVSETFRKLICL